MMLAPRLHRSVPLCTVTKMPLQHLPSKGTKNTPGGHDTRKTAKQPNGKEATSCVLCKFQAATLMALCTHINTKHRGIQAKNRDKVKKAHNIDFCGSCRQCMLNLEAHFCEEMGQTWDPQAPGTPWGFLRNIKKEELQGRHTVYTQRTLAPNTTRVYTKLLQIVMDNASRPQPKKDAIPSQEDYAKLLLLLPTWILQATMSRHKPIFDVERNLKLFMSKQ